MPTRAKRYRWRIVCVGPTCKGARLEISTYAFRTRAAARKAGTAQKPYYGEDSPAHPLRVIVEEKP